MHGQQMHIAIIWAKLVQERERHHKDMNMEFVKNSDTNLHQYLFHGYNWTEIIEFIKLVRITGVKVLIYSILQNPNRVLIPPMKLHSKFWENCIRDIVCRVIPHHIYKSIIPIYETMLYICIGNRNSRLMWKSNRFELVCTQKLVVRTLNIPHNPKNQSPA